MCSHNTGTLTRTPSFSLLQVARAIVGEWDAGFQYADNRASPLVKNILEYARFPSPALPPPPHTPHSLLRSRFLSPFFIHFLWPSLSRIMCVLPAKFLPEHANILLFTPGASTLSFTDTSSAVTREHVATVTLMNNALSTAKPAVTT